MVVHGQTENSSLEKKKLFNLIRGPKVVRLRQPVLDAMSTAEPVEPVHAGRCRGTETLAWWVTELDAVVSWHHVDTRWYGLHVGVQDPVALRRSAVCPGRAIANFEVLSIATDR